MDNNKRLDDIVEKLKQLESENIKLKSEISDLRAGKIHIKSWFLLKIRQKSVTFAKFISSLKIYPTIFFHTALKKSSIIAGTIFGILLTASIVYAVAVTYNFSSGTTASASEVNQNFTDLAGAVTTLESNGQWADNAGDISYSGGYVGIGTISPKVTLQAVIGSSAIPSNDGNPIANGVFSATAGGESLTIGSFVSGTIWMQGQNSTVSNNHRNISINPDGGNVGIGTISPLASLHIKGPTANIGNVNIALFRNSASEDMFTIRDDGIVNIKGAKLYSGDSPFNNYLVSEFGYMTRQGTISNVPTATATSFLDMDNGTGTWIVTVHKSGDAQVHATAIVYHTASDYAVKQTLFFNNGITFSGAVGNFLQLTQTTGITTSFYWRASKL